MTARITTPFAIAAVVLLVSVPDAVTATDAREERTVYVTVLGPNGPIMEGLAPEEFRIFEDNVEREVTGLAPAEHPLSAVLMIDTTPDAEPYVQDMRKAVVDYARVLFGMSPNARLAIAEFAGVGMIAQRFTSSLEEIESHAQKIVANTQSAPVFNEGLMAAADELQRESTPRRVIVTINMEPTGENSTVRIPNVAAKVRDSGASVFSIAMQLGQERNANRDALLNGVTTNSGGLRMQINAITALEGLLGTIASISAAQWAVTFNRPDGAPVAEQTQAQVMRANVRVLTNMWSKPAGGGPPAVLPLDVLR